VLARLGQIDGVENSYVNESGTLIRLSLRPGVDAERVATEVRRTLKEQVEDRTAVRLGGGEASAALRREEWRDERRVAASVAAEMQAAEMRAAEGQSSEESPLRGVLLALLLGGIAVVLWLLWRRRRQATTERERNYKPSPAV
jgi:hypothetical protein